MILTLLKYRFGMMQRKSSVQEKGCVAARRVHMSLMPFFAETLRLFLQEHSLEEHNGHGVLDHGVDAHGCGNDICILASVAMLF